MQDPALLTVRGLSLSFTRYDGFFRKTRLEVISELSLTLREGEILAVVGASGSGKSLLAHAILGLLPDNAATAGEILYCGEALTQKRLNVLRGSEIFLVPQSVSYLDPLMRVGAQLRGGRHGAEQKKKALAALGRYGLGAEAARLYPFELSGGMARRVLIGTAVMEPPRLVIADEPTPGLHPAAARRVLSHFRELAKAGAGVLLITHDLELAAENADRVLVLYAGTTVEEARAADFSDEALLRHPYTKALWRAMPKHGFTAPSGAQPYAADRPEGCAYRRSCPLAEPRCAGEIPCLAERGGHVRCLPAPAEKGGAAP